MNPRTYMRATLFAALAMVLAAGETSAQLPFDVTQDDLLAVDSTAFRWTALRASVGAVEGELSYVVEEVMPEVCRAVALYGMLRLRNYYMREEGGVPVSMRMNTRCGPDYVGVLEYDGVYVHLKLLDRRTNDLVYQGRYRGLP